MTLTREQQQRYARQLALSAIGKHGQELLLDAHVLVVGVGGLGCPVVQYLAAAGVGQLTLVDADQISLSNLQRQILFRQDDLGKAKVDVAKETIVKLNSDVKVNAHAVRLTEKNAEDLILRADIVVDASDNFETRFLVNRICVKQRKTLVWAAIYEFEGQVSVVKASQPDAGCFQCFCPSIPGDRGLPNCSDQGIVGSIAGVVASIQATEVLKELLSLHDSLAGRLVCYDGLTTSIRNVRLAKNEQCPVCSHPSTNKARSHATL